jgi:hypothetical protein
MPAQAPTNRLARLTQQCLDLLRPRMDVTTLGRVDMTDPASRDSAGRTAILICHGMGQQVRWQTLGELVDALRASGSVETVGTRLARFEDTHGEFVLGRVDLTIHGPGGEHREVHLYESYWAPITEGGVRLRDVVAFLKDAGFRGMRHALKPFVRFMFGQPREFQKRAPWVALPLGAVLAVFFALLSLNASIAAVTAQGVLSPRAMNARSSATLYVLAIEASALIYLLVTVLVSLWRDWRRRATPEYYIHRRTRRMLKVLLGIVGVVTIVAGVVVPLDLAQMGPGWLRLTVELPWPVTAAVWAGAAWLAARTRRLLVQYVGDVVAYVSGFQVSRYDEIRNKIQDSGKRILCALYRDGGYGHYIVVGHSLGSVVAYDALNDAIAEDRWHPQRKMRVVERTRAFITFGSPLDKIAFIFRTQSRDGDVREALASQVQPLIDEPARPVWINIYSRQDPISASLEFYDHPNQAGLKVRNVEDHQADLPLLAHTQYWRNRLLADVILAQIPAPAAAPASAPGGAAAATP